MLTTTDGADFAAVQRAPRVYLTGDLDQVLGVTDVWQARMERIVPLPVRTREPGGEVRVSVYVPPAQAEPAPSPARVTPRSPVVAEEPARVTQWKNALLDLSLRNRLLNYSARSGLPLAVPGQALGQLEDLLHQGIGIALRPADDLGAIERERGIQSGRDLPDEQLAALLATRRTVYADVTDAAYHAKLRGLAHKARTIIEETGANNLYLALGSLVWEHDGRALRSPLILIPVTLKAAARGRFRVLLDDAGSSTPNYCLIEKLGQVYGLDIPGLAAPAMDSAGIDLDAALRATRIAIAERELPFRVEPTADLTVLQFAKFRLWKDLDESWAVFAANPLVRHLMTMPTEAFADPVHSELIVDLDGLAENCPVPADSSQLRAVADAVAGRTFVLEGPPGTGKSQTITNLLAHAVANGKRVLFVAEKRAALDVVRKRLDRVGMGPLCLDLHDKGSSPVAVREQIKRALEHTVVTDQLGVAATLDELRSAQRDLIRYVYRLHDRNHAGLSLYAAEESVLARGGEVAPMPIPVDVLGSITEDGLAQLRALFGRLPDVAYPARPRPEHPWAFVTSHRLDPATVLPAARQFDEAVHALPEVPAVRGPDDLRALATLLADGTPLAVLDEVRTPRWQTAIEAALGEVTAFACAAHPGLDLVEPGFLDLPLTEIRAQADTAASSGIFGRRKRLRAVHDRLAPRLRAEVKPKQIPGLAAALVTVQDGVRGLIGKLNALPGIALPADWNPFTTRQLLDERVGYLRWAASIVDPAHGTLRDFLGGGATADPALVAEAARAAEELCAACHAEAEQIGDWAGERGLVGRWADTRTERALGDDQLSSLRRWLALLAHLEPLRGEHLDEVRLLVLRGEQAGGDALRAFELGLAVTSIGERRSAGGLADFDAAAHERTVARYVRSADQLRDQLTSELPRRVLRSRSFDPNTTGGRVGLLHRQITRLRGGMRVRELMTEFGDLVARAMPCVLVSPDSVARFFPAKAGLFDIVVFDEASQVRVADAIGAMGRANSVVVVGDSKQMPPTTFAESTVTPADVDGAEQVEDEESILTECVQARVERHRLTWHYRSQDESLIAFSNNHYYDGNLMSFPAPATSDTGVRLVRVNGEFLRSGQGAFLRTNPVEADAVVAEIRRRFRASPDRLPSLGVVTFNHQQRAHIEGLLWDTEDPRIIEALDDANDGLFVKNLENVQGDERDVIFFSTAFSVNKRGVLPLNFGPLNRVGGERRLNVAVTRARREVVVFSSFDPAQLRADETTSVGIKDLRSYLDMAQHGSTALPADHRRRAIVDRHGEDIAEALRARGLAVRTQVGLSDFKVDLAIAAPEQPSIPLVAVLLDGPSWAARLTVRDRDGLPEEVLSALLHWPLVQRVWLPDWLDHRDEVIERLVKVVADHPVAEVPVERPIVTTRPAAPPVMPDESLVRFTPWRPTQAGTVDVLDQLPQPAALATLTAVLTDIVTAEGPIHADRLAKLAAGAFGLTRLTEVRRAAILSHLPAQLRRDHDEPVLWPAHLIPEDWRGFRTTPPGADRPLEYVPLREIANAMAATARAAAGMRPDELSREVLAVFGGKRLTSTSAERLHTALDLGVRWNLLKIDAAGTVTATGS